MTRLYAFVKLLVAWGVLAVLGMLFIVLWHLDEAVRPARVLPEHVTHLLSTGQDLLAHTDQRLNGTGIPKAKDYAVLPALVQATRDVRQTTVDANVEQKAYYQDLKARTDDLGDRFRDQVFGEHGTVPRLNSSLTMLTGDTHEVLVKLPATVQATTKLLNQTTRDMEELAEVVGDPEIKVAIQNLATTSGDVERTTASLALLMADVQGKVHTLTHPTKKQRALSALLSTVKLAYYLSQLR